MIHGKKNDEYLTPPELLSILGPFSLDPCCPEGLPWRTAKRMFTKADGGLKQGWSRYGRIWLNPPYSDVTPWAEKFVEHRRGIALVSAKSTDAK